MPDNDPVTDAIRALEPCDACETLPEYLQIHVPLVYTARLQKLRELVERAEQRRP